MRSLLAQPSCYFSLEMLISTFGYRQLSVFLGNKPATMFSFLTDLSASPNYYPIFSDIFLLYCTLVEHRFIIRYGNEHLKYVVFENSFSLPENLDCYIFLPINAIRTLIIHHMLPYNILFYNGIAWNSYVMIAIVYIISAIFNPDIFLLR